ncbi:hypothetical protein AB0M02_13195 [Actinoplanes sp. NPDC051861]|uniref:hypothetical protein n=1 Tax=Actinoplanes sp. NPDC051861 TaxID=3155170 RepID=UPI00343F1C23
MNSVKRTAGVLSASLFAITAGAFATAAPAAAASRNIDNSSWSVPASCNNSTNLLCLYYRGSLGGAMFSMRGYVSNLNNARFSGSGDGSGLQVRNRAASMANASFALTGYSWVYINRGGNYDYLPPGGAGQLYYTWNNGASAEII